MRIFLLLLSLVAVSLNSFSQQTVQGIPYNNPRKIKSSEKLTPPLLAGGAPFTFDDIQNWTGEGENQAAVVIQFNTGKDNETTAMVFGYRWDGEKTGADMILAIAECDPRFYILANYGGYGYSIGGMGWDADEDGDNYLVNNNVRYDLVNGKYECSSEYDYDNFTAGDTDDFWAGGWFSGYWSYYTSNSGPENFGYSGVGATNRILTNNSWDGWNFCAGMSSYSWLPFAAAPSLVPKDAVTEFKIDGIYYTLGSYQKKTVYVSAPKEMEGETLTSYTGEITIPTTFKFGEEEYTVVGIDKNAFENATVTTVSLPATVTEIKDEAFKNSGLSAINLQSVGKIGKYAFAGCSQLKNVVFSSSVNKISEGTFSASGITSISLENITSVDASAFANCLSLATVSGWSSVETIGASAFEGCTTLASVVFDASLKSVGATAFAGCDGLTKVDAKSITPLAITDDVFGEKTYSTAILTVPYDYKAVYANSTGWKNFVNIEEETIAVNVGDFFYKNNVAYIVLSNDETSKTVKVTHFPSEENNQAIAAANKVGYVGEIVIPATIQYQKIEFNVVDIEENALRGATQMTSLAINNNNIKVLPKNVLYQCTGLISISLPAELETIGEYALYYCSALENISIPASVKTIGSRAFYYCSKLSDIKLPENLESIGEYAFNNCTSLTKFEFPKNITEVKNYLFSGCTNLAEVKFGENVTTIGTSAFNKCSSLSSIELPASLTSIGQNAFAGAGLTSISFPASLTTLGNSAFDGCKQLSSVKVPETVTSIGTGVFKNCTGLKSVELPATLTSLSNNIFSGCSGLTEFTFPAALTSIGQYAFQNCTGFVSFVIPETVTSIGQYAFSGCSSLTSIKLPSTLKSIETRTFEKCAKLTAIELPTTITTINSYAFANCSGLTELNLPESLTSIGNYAFQNCTGVVSFEIPESVTSIGNYAFSGCSSLVSIKLPSALSTINSSLFNGCAKLTAIKLPDTVTSLGGSAFYNCSSLTMLEIPEKVTSIGYNTFYGCSALSIYVCNPEPFNLINDLKTGSSTYAPLYVPYTAKDAYESHRYWGKGEVLSICPEVVFDMENHTCGVNSQYIDIKVPVLYNYAENYQGLDRFIEANTSSVKAVSEVRLKYRVAPAELPSEMKKEAPDYISVDAEEIDGIYSAQLSGLSVNTTYEYVWEYELQGFDVLFTSETAYFTTLMTGLNDVELGESANEKVEYYTLHGVKVENSNLANGIYIRKVGNKVEKIIINN